MCCCESVELFGRIKVLFIENNFMLEGDLYYEPSRPRVAVSLNHGSLKGHLGVAFSPF